MADTDTFLSANWVTHDAAGFFTFLLVIVGLGQAGLFLWQLRLMRKGFADAKEAAEAAKLSVEVANESLKLSRDTTQKQLRAYVFAFDADVFDAGTDSVRASIAIKNSGQTPAYDVKVSIAANAFYVTDDITFHPTPVGPDTKTFVFGPGGSGRRDIPLRPIIGEPASVSTVKDGNGALYVWGEILYTDTFGKDQYTRFRFMIGGKDGWPDDNKMFLCSNGNEASQDKYFPVNFVAPP